jgi:hypothetical protein
MRMRERFTAPERMTDGELAVVVHQVAAHADPLAARYLEEAARRLILGPPGNEPLRLVLRGISRARGDLNG